MDKNESKLTDSSWKVLLLRVLVDDARNIVNKGGIVDIVEFGRFLEHISLPIDEMIMIKDTQNRTKGKVTGEKILKWGE